MNKYLNFTFFLKNKLTAAASVSLFLTFEIWAQMPRVVIPEQEPEPVEDYTWWYIMLFVLAIGLAGAIYWWLNEKKKQKNEVEQNRFRQQGKKSRMDTDALDLNKELEWFRKNQKSVNTSHKKKKLPKMSQVLNRKANNDGLSALSLNLEQKSGEFLPVFAIRKLESARPFDHLTISNDEALMSAVEQAHDEFEEDETVRELAVRVLTAFKTRNSVEALSQVALYDLSSNLRSKAVSTLADFDHESVFETIVLACADPTREVRAAAARGLFKLSCDRADAWTRIAETNDLFRMKQAARAAIEGDLVEKYFDRLVHQDMKNAYEAFALVALLLKSGETEMVFNALEKHKNVNVRKAILHVIKITKERNALEGLYTLLENKYLSPEMREEVDKIVEEIGLVTA
ncbi:MAG TPA: HEAT repeat domain-containing protein [Pyrinomonadaceae bacterium]|nr:HEAT repeat domain-containing protein [Pyrinomonadaceae bacterium]